MADVIRKSDLVSFRQVEAVNKALTLFGMEGFNREKVLKWIRAGKHSRMNVRQYALSLKFLCDIGLFDVTGKHNKTARRIGRATVENAWKVARYKRGAENIPWRNVKTIGWQIRKSGEATWGIYPPSKRTPLPPLSE